MRLLRRLSLWSLRRLDRTVILGRCMERPLLAGGMPAHKLARVPSWADGKQVGLVDRQGNGFLAAHGLQDRFVVIYSGNLGVVHEFETIQEMIREVGSIGQIRFCFVGDGSQKGRLAEAAGRAGGGNVVFLPYQPKERLRFSLAAGDVHLVSLRPEIVGLSVPSKLYGILAAGRPAIFIGPEESEVAAVIREAGCWYVIRPGRGQGAVEALLACYRDRGHLERQGRAARAYFSAIAIARWPRRDSGASSSFFFTFLAAAIADYFFGPLSYFDPAPWEGLFLGAGLMVLLGAWDDMRPLGASTKFLVQLGAAGLALGFDFQIHGLPLLGHPISSSLLSIPLTLLWILLITNAFNLIDGLDGLSGGLAFIAGLTLVALSLVRGDVQTALPATVMLPSSPSASLMVIDFLLFSYLTAAARTSFRLLEYVKFRGKERERRALIYGAGRGGDRERRGTLLCSAPLLLHLRSKAGVPPEPAAGAKAGGAGGRRSREGREEF